MNSYLKVAVAAVSLSATSVATAYKFEVLQETVLTGGSIIRLVEYGPQNNVGIWLLEDEDLVLIDAETGARVATCDRTVPGDEIFGEYGGNAINIDGVNVQYSGIDGTSLAGWTMNCLTGEVQRVGNFIPTFTQPDGNYSVGYDGRNTNIYYENGVVDPLHLLSERIFYYSGNDTGDLLAGYQATDDGNIVPYVNTMGVTSNDRGVAVVRDTPFGESVIMGRAISPTVIRQEYITPSEEAMWNRVNTAFVMADANPDGFIFNRYSIGEGQHGGEDIIGNDCVITDDPQDIEPDIKLDEVDVIDKWCQSFVRQNNIVYVATGDSWQNSYKVIKLQFQAAEQVFTTNINGCLDSPPVGDGWGWDGVNSCRIESTNVVSSGQCFDSPPLGDGFGWDGVNTCRIDPSENTASVAYDGDCFDSPPLNNGFGWDGQASCQLETSVGSAVILVNGDCIETAPLGNGYGYDGTNGCQVSPENSTGTLVVPATGNCIDHPPFNDGLGLDGSGSAVCRIESALIAVDGVCIDIAPIGDGRGFDGYQGCDITTTTTLLTDGDCVDTPPTGDGWGWDGTASCRISGVLLDADENGCVDSPPLGDGWGWDGTASCQIQY